MRFLWILCSFLFVGCAAPSVVSPTTVDITPSPLSQIVGQPQVIHAIRYQGQLTIAVHYYATRGQAHIHNYGQYLVIGNQRYPCQSEDVFVTASQMKGVKSYNNEYIFKIDNDHIPQLGQLDSVRFVLTQKYNGQDMTIDQTVRIRDVTHE